MVTWHYLLASSLSALVARFVTHPIDTIKTRMQVAHRPLTIVEVVRAHSLLSLYEGVTVTLWLCAPALSVYLSVYESSKQYGADQWQLPLTSMALHLFSGCVAEIVAGLLFTPMEVIKTRLQVQSLGSHDDNNGTSSTLTHKHTWHVIVDLYEHEGWRAFYKGYWLSLLVFAPQSAIYFVVYEQAKIHWPPTLATFLFGSMLASCISVAIANPLDVIKTRWQSTRNFTQYTVTQLVMETLKTEGIAGFLKGTTARICWGVPMTTISFSLFEVFKV
ncbi:mitochondrial carrier domain-containing protein [Gongronella butleri]|nr:mitochondrial carrier domain-containing protein [Gongronella butleri]